MEKSRKTAYDMQYAKENVVKKLVPFNLRKPEDVALLDWLNRVGKGNVTGYIKGLIMKDMKENEQ